MSTRGSVDGSTDHHGELSIKIIRSQNITYENELLAGCRLMIAGGPEDAQQREEFAFWE